MNLQNCPVNALWDPINGTCITRARSPKRYRELRDLTDQELEQGEEGRRLTAFERRQNKRIGEGYWKKYEGKKRLYKFTLHPGEEGFNAEMKKAMKGLLTPDDELHCPAPGQPKRLQPYQKTLAFETDPTKTPVNRILVAHRTGAGKTLEIIRLIISFTCSLCAFPHASVLPASPPRTQRAFVLETPPPSPKKRKMTTAQFIAIGSSPPMFKN